MSKQFGRCQVCEKNRRVVVIYFASEGFLVTFACGHQVSYQAKMDFDVFKVKVK